MLVSFTMIPLDKGPSFSKYVAKITRIIEDSGLPNQLTPMSTVVEGDWDEVMSLIDRCRLALREDSDRVSISIKIDDKAGASGMLTTKVESVREKLEND